MAFRLFLLLSVAVCAAHPHHGKKGEMPGYQLFEGDMMFTKEQIQAAENGLDPSQAGGARGLNKHRRWPNAVVPYVIHKSLKNPFLNGLGIKGPTEKEILGAIKEWEQKTCIRFVPRTNEKDYVEFYYGTGCSSWIGKTGDKQQISIGKGCNWHYIIIHEIGHALGFFHEQSRPDRDNYVEILWNNIKKDKKSQFTKYSHGIIDSLGVPYDYGSIMHYTKDAFAKASGLITIKPKKAGVSIGVSKNISPLDAKQMNLFYSCN